MTSPPDPGDTPRGTLASREDLGRVLLAKGRLDEAIAAFAAVIGLAPARASAHLYLGNALYLAGRLDEAIASFRAAAALAPDRAEAHSNLGHALKDLARLDEALGCFRAAIALDPGHAAIHSNLLYTLWYHHGTGPRAIVEEHRRWAERHADPLTATSLPHDNDSDPDRRLRIGYVSADFTAHPLGLLVAPLLAAHDPEAFEIVCYSDVRRPDAVTRRIHEAAARWRPSAGLSDAALARLIRHDRVDVLVDLSLHMAGNRLLAFALKPAPVQVTYLAYPATSGMRAMDYRISDDHLDPIDAAETQGPEQVVRLPGSYWAYPESPDDPPVGPAPGPTRGHVTFGALNNFCKLNPGVLATWREILWQVPGARLLVLTNGRSDGYLSLLRSHGIPRERLTLVERRPRTEYLRLYHEVDVSLDPFPCGGHTTSLDALWMGVPVVALAGRTAMGRAAVSILSTLGLTELVAHTPEAYIRIATDLASDPCRLAALRAGLRERMRRSPLGDPPRLTRHLEGAYRAMWAAWCGPR